MPGTSSVLRAWAAQCCEQARSARRCSVRAAAQSSSQYERVLRYPNGVSATWLPFTPSGNVSVFKRSCVSCDSGRLLVHREGALAACHMEVSK